MWEVFTALLGVVAMVLGYYLKKEKTKAEKIEDAAKQANKAILDMRRKINDGKLHEVQADLDNLDFRVRNLLRLRKKTRDS